MYFHQSLVNPSSSHISAHVIIFIISFISYQSLAHQLKQNETKACNLCQQLGVTAYSVAGSYWPLSRYFGIKLWKTELYKVRRFSKQRPTSFQHSCGIALAAWCLLLFLHYSQASMPGNGMSGRGFGSTTISCSCGHFRSWEKLWSSSKEYHSGHREIMHWGGGRSFQQQGGKVGSSTHLAIVLLTVRQESLLTLLQDFASDLAESPRGRDI